MCSVRWNSQPAIWKKMSWLVFDLIADINLPGKFNRLGIERWSNKVISLKEFHHYHWVCGPVGPSGTAGIKHKQYHTDWQSPCKNDLFCQKNVYIIFLLCVRSYRLILTESFFCFNWHTNSVFENRNYTNSLYEKWRVRSITVIVPH